MAGSITFTGLSSGTDWTKIIEQLVEVESYRKTQMETWKTTWEDKITSIQGLNSRLLSLESFANSRNSVTEFLATTAASSDTDVLNATSSSTAIPGAHSITVGSNIQDKVASQGVAATSTVISSRDGTMTIYVGSSHIDVAVTNGMTLSGLQTAIEAADGSNILTAEIMDDGSSSNPKRLSLLANTGGSSNLVSVTANPSNLTFSEGSINPVINAAGWSGTSQATSSGMYLGSSNKTYTFTVPTVNVNGANSATSVSWSKTGGGTGSFVIPANYTAGTALFVDGLVDDAAHSSSWSGTAKATSGGNYTGSLEKSYTFTVPTGTVGTGDLSVAWSEASTGRSGTITIPNAYVPGTAINVDGINDVVEGSGWTGTSEATSSGNYTASTNQIYTFTVQTVNGGAGTGTVGTDTIVVHWQNTDNSTNGDITLDGTYTAGTAVSVENGLKVAFAAGTLSTNVGNSFTVNTEQGPTVSFSAGDLVNGNSFTIDAHTGLKMAFSTGTLVNTEQFYVDGFSNVDSVQNGTWSGAAVTSGGHYLGSTNKTFHFTVGSSGTLGTDELTLEWTDTGGNSGTVTIPDDYTPGTNLNVYQGVKISLAAGNLVAGDNFSIDAYSPALQAGQNSGLAQVEQVVHSGIADKDTTKVTTSDAIFSYTYGGTRINVDVDADTTLEGLVAVINNDSANPGLTASILNDGLGLSTSYHLVLTGRDSGAAYKITNIQESFAGGTFSSSDFTTTQKAQNSMLKVDGYPTVSSEYIQRSTNLIADVIDGVTLSLVSSGSATVSITEDLTSIRNTIATFVTSVNFVLDYVKAQTKYDAETKKSGIMIGNYSFQIVQQRIKNLLTDSIPGLVDGVDPYTHLAQIGITTNPDNEGKWEVDASILSNALEANLDGVKRLFIQDEGRGIDGILQLLSDELENLNDSEDGPMNVLIENYKEIIENLDDKIAFEEKRIALVEDRLKEKFARLESLLSQLNGQETYLETLIGKLPSVGGTTSQ